MAVVQPDMLFSEIIDFLASTPTPENIIAFKPPDKLEQRLSLLLEQNRQHKLTAEELTELDEFLRMNHFMNMLKIRAREKANHRTAHTGRACHGSIAKAQSA